jgi:hypothetical protein
MSDERTPGQPLLRPEFVPILDELIADLEARAFALSMPPVKPETRHIAWVAKRLLAAA